jgi:transcriptional regulator with XRE-family HTH domain
LNRRRKSALRTRRTAEKRTLEQVAVEAGVDIATIDRLELDPVKYLNSNYATVVSVARAMGCSNPLDLFPVPEVKRTSTEPRV